MVATINPPGLAAVLDPIRISGVPRRGFLRSWHWFGSTLDRSRRNLADMDLPSAGRIGLTQDPAIVTPNNYTLSGLNGTNYLTEAIPDAPYTMLAIVARSSDTHATSGARPGYGGWSFGEGTGPTLTGGLTLTSAATAPSYAVGTSAVFSVNGTPARQSRTIAQALATMQAYRLYFVLAAHQIGLGIWNWTDKTGQLHEIKQDRVLAATSVLRWGNVLGGVSGGLELAMGAAWTGETPDALLTDAEMTQVQKLCNARFAKLGGPVV